MSPVRKAVPTIITLVVLAVLAFAGLFGYALITLADCRKTWDPICVTYHRDEF